MLGIESIHTLSEIPPRSAIFHAIFHAYEEEFSFLLYNNFLLGDNEALLYI